MTIRAVDCQGFAGGFTLGTVQAGFTLVGKREMGKGFGVPNCEVNRHLLGWNWTAESCDPAMWTVPPEGAELVFGNPPCSGFSGLSSKGFRGVNSPINHCMWAFVEYAARVKPFVAVFESVRAAYTKGRPLMRDLRARLEARTGLTWTLHHVVHDAHALGGPAIRRRYFWVVSRVPFGVEHPELPYASTLQDTIGDLEYQPLSMSAEQYAMAASERTLRYRSIMGVVDGHITLDNPQAVRLTELAAMIGWRQGYAISEEARRCYETYGRLPDSWRATEDQVVKKDFNFGFNGAVRWRYDAPARVVTGAGPNIGVHPTQDRPFTHREVARIMGFPDDWLIEPLKASPGLPATWGKGITVDAGRWIAHWARRSIEGTPGSLEWTQVGNRELEVNVSKPRVCGRVDKSTRSMTKGHAMTAPQGPQVPQAPTMITPEAPAFQTPQAPSHSTVEDPAVTPAATDEQVSTSEEQPKSKGRGRGRGRPSDVVERDEQVLNAVNTDGITREEIAEATGLDSVRVYQSLWRLRRDGKVERVRNGRAHSWKLAAGPVPDAA